MKKNLQYAVLVALIMSVFQIIACSLFFISKIPESDNNIAIFWVISALISVGNFAGTINALTYSPKEKKSRFLAIVVFPVLGIIAGANSILVIGIFAFVVFIVMLSFIIWDHDFAIQ